MVEEAVGGQENYDAYTGLKESVSVIQKTLNETNIRVNALKSKDGKYAVDGKYAANEAKLQEEIDGYTSAISEAFKNETCVAWKAETKASLRKPHKRLPTMKQKQRGRGCIRGCSDGIWLTMMRLSKKFGKESRKRRPRGSRLQW